MRKRKRLLYYDPYRTILSLKNSGRIEAKKLNETFETQ
ncbi:hypothetical protein LEP1GSC013_2304 [Leptospira interrogans serovar Valbuzzi str. Duyster]|nr:hypothetical protein LEP1GSC013_2304 [Leptospira interrogans serovar Valbuzzi str. Duyster]ENO72252.1 hypothetical protein LEP1GSC012_2129 [Leptospira interrogans serovar Valbuzzi str. Valbuzzi]